MGVSPLESCKGWVSPPEGHHRTMEWCCERKRRLAHGSVLVRVQPEVMYIGSLSNIYMCGCLFLNQALSFGADVEVVSQSDGIRVGIVRFGILVKYREAFHARMKIGTLVWVRSGRSVLDGLVWERHVAGRGIMSLLRWTVMPLLLGAAWDDAVDCMPPIHSVRGLHCNNIHWPNRWLFGSIPISCRADPGRVQRYECVISNGQINGTLYTAAAG
jgi:hypothetical protein